jgi:hypothetical protein
MPILGFARCALIVFVDTLLLRAIPQTAILLHGKCTDPEHFVEKVFPEFNFEEDKQEIRDALGL